MSFTDVFGGQLIFPSQLSYLSITTAVDITLQWPTEQQITDGNVVADFMDVDTTAPSLNIDMPSALVTGTGNKGSFNNVGANSFTVRDNTGGTIQTVQPGETWIVVLRDNTTTAGLWRTFQLGANVAVASASALAGAGIKAIGLLLNQQIDSDVEAATPFTIVDGDRAKCLIYTAGTGTANLTAAATLGNDWFCMLRNSGSGTLNVLPPAGLIDGVASINLDPNDSAFIFTDGTDFFTVGLSSGSTLAFDFVSIPVPGSGDFVLSGANLDRISYRFTGALTGNRKIVVPTTTQQYWVDNQTTGAFTLEVGTAAQGTPPQVAQGETVIFYCDATDVVNAVSSTSISFPVLISQGGTSATDAATALANLGAVATAFDLIAGAGIVGGGDLSSSPRTFDVGAGTGITVNVDDVQLELANTRNVDHAVVSLLAGLGIDPTGLGDLTASRTINAFAASEAQVGVAELANQAETDAGADDLRIVTPLKLAGRAASETLSGVIEIADQAETDAGTDDTRAITPLKLANAPGAIQLAEKPSDQNKSNDIVLADDTALTLSLVAGTYMVDLQFLFNAFADGTMGITWRLNCTGTITRSRFGRSTRINAVINALTSVQSVNTTNNAGTITTSVLNSDYIIYRGTLVISTSAVLSLQWAQDTTNANALTMKQSSFLMAIKQ